MPLNHGLIDNLTVHLPHLHPALEGLRIAHFSDPHITAQRPRHERMIRQLSRIQIDLIVMTGDYMTAADREQEQAAAAVLTLMCKQVRPRYGFFGVFGNHDSEALKPLVNDLPIDWLHNHAVAHERLPLRFVGFDHTDTAQPDAVATARAIARCKENEISTAQAKVSRTVTANRSGSDPSESTGTSTEQQSARQAISFSPDRAAQGGTAQIEKPPATIAPLVIAPEDRLNIFLAHSPIMLPTASDMDADIFFAGHTHGGQMRLPTGRALHNSTDLPLRLTSGLLRHRDTLAVVCRGIGTNGLPLRFLCPPHIPIVTLRTGPMPGRPTDEIDNIAPW